MSRQPVGTFCLVLHSHLPWLAHHGNWPVGEEWLHQAWANSYQPIWQMLRRFADEGRRDVLTLGMTPVLAAQLDDPYCVREQYTWLGYWSVRAQGLAGARERHRAQRGRAEFTAAAQALEDFEAHWSRGGSPTLRALADAQVVEVLGGPATHPFLPLAHPRVAAFALRVGLDDAVLRRDARPGTAGNGGGIWLPECGYRPGLEHLLSDAGVQHLMLDGPTLLGAGASTADAWTLGDSDVIAFGRDLDVTYRVWSPRRGYPGGRWYRDFHTFDHEWGLRPARVTGRHIPPHQKAPYEPDAAAAAADADAADFVAVVRDRLTQLAAERGRPGLVVAAYDTELFGHWWHEGPYWLEQVLRMLPAAGVRVTTLRGAVDAGAVAGAVHAGPGSWGSGKDWRVWDGESVGELVDDARALERLALTTVDATSRAARSPAHDQLVRELLLALSSDWAFMVSKDSAAQYARERAAGHAAAVRTLAEAIGSDAAAGSSRALAERLRCIDGPFGHLDARAL